MAERIDGFMRPTQTSSESRVNSPNTPANQPASGLASGQSEARSGGAQATDSVSLTESARRLSELSSEAVAGESVDMSRVESARQAIDDGTYNIDARNIAERLLSMEDSIGE